jgi:hypothetical protein
VTDVMTLYHREPGDGRESPEKARVAHGRSQIALIRNAITLMDSRIVCGDWDKIVQPSLPRAAGFHLGRSHQHKRSTREPLAQGVVAEHGCQRLLR